MFKIVWEKIRRCIASICCCRIVSYLLLHDFQASKFRPKMNITNIRKRIGEWDEWFKWNSCRVKKKLVGVKKLLKPLLYLRLNIQMYDHCYRDFRGFMYEFVLDSFCFISSFNISIVYSNIYGNVFSIYVSHTHSCLILPFLRCIFSEMAKINDNFLFRWDISNFVVANKNEK